MEALWAGRKTSKCRSPRSNSTHQRGTGVEREELHRVNRDLDEGLVTLSGLVQRLRHFQSNQGV